MTQNKYGVLVSLFVLLLLTAGFFAGARAAFDKLNTSVASAAATSTPTSIAYPTATPAGARSPGAQQSPGAAARTAAAAPTETPLPQSAQVVMNTSPSTNNPQSSIPSGTSQFWCIVKFPTLPAGTIKFRFQNLATPGDYFSYPEQVTNTMQSAYLEGPLQRGKWRCLVELNGATAGSASFTIT